MLFLIAQIRRFGTLNATQKTAALYKALFFKNQEKLQEIGRFHKKGIFDYFLAVFPDFLKKLPEVEKKVEKNFNKKI